MTGRRAARADSARENAPALRLIHVRPAESWAIADLATRSGISRSAFAARFTKFVGEAPMQYLTGWRLREAASMLRGSSDGIGLIATRARSDSEASFGKAFKRSLGVAPDTDRHSSVRALVEVRHDGEWTARRNARAH